MPRRHLSIRFIVAIVQNIWCCVKDATNPMTTKIPHGGKSERNNVVFDDCAKLFVVAAGLDEIASLDPAIVGCLQQSLRFRIGAISDHKHFTAVSVVTVQVHSNIHIHNVAIL